MICQLAAKKKRIALLLFSILYLDLAVSQLAYAGKESYPAPYPRRSYTFGETPSAASIAAAPSTEKMGPALGARMPAPDKTTHVIAGTTKTPVIAGTTKTPDIT